MTVYVNARFRRRPTTGVERVATEILAHLSHRVVEVEAPAWAQSGPAGHIWEQTVLPHRSPGPLWSPCNTGPLRVHRQVVTIHDTAPLLHPEWFSTGFARAYQLLVPRLCQSAERIVTVSHSVADELLALGADARRVHVIGNGVSEWFRPAPPPSIAEVQDRFGLAGRPYFVALGSPEPRKNLARLLEAWRTAHLPEARLVLVGRAASNVFRPVELPPDPTVLEVGRIDDRDLAPLLGGAVALVSPSLYEGFGLPPVEALACGTPVVVSDIAVHRSLLAPFDPVVVDPQDVASIALGLEQMLASRPSVDAAGIRERFSWKRAAEQYDALFDEVDEAR